MNNILNDEFIPIKPTGKCNDIVKLYIKRSNDMTPIVSKDYSNPSKICKIKCGRCNTICNKGETHTIDVSNYNGTHDTIEVCCKCFEDYNQSKISSNFSPMAKLNLF